MKATQAQSFAVLPKPKPVPVEDPKFANAHCLDDLNLDNAEKSDEDTPLKIPEFTLLRCAIEGCGDKNPTSEELFGMLETRFKWLKTEKGRSYEVSLPFFMRICTTTYDNTGIPLVNTHKFTALPTSDIVGCFCTTP